MKKKMEMCKEKKGIKIKSTRVLGILLFLVVFALSMIVAVKSVEKNEKVLQGSQVTIENLDAFQIQQLSKLGKVWGFVKYYHPAVVGGEVDWDQALFEVMPKVLLAKNAGDVDRVLYDWIMQLGQVVEGVAQDSREKVIEADLQWIMDEDYISKELSELLVGISKTYIPEREKAYVTFQNNGIFASLNHEEAYPRMQYGDDGYKLLSLFRYWNIIEYYYPYRTVLDQDWGDVLTEFIPKFNQCEDELSYKLTVCELVSHIQDSHGSVVDQGGALYRYWGANFAPFKFQIIDNQVVVTKVAQKYEATCKVKPGDVVLKLNGREIDEVIAEKACYLSISHEEGLANVLQYYLFRTSESGLTLTIERDGKESVEQVACYNGSSVFTPETESHKLLDNNIGYINPEALKKDEIHQIMKMFKDTKGLVVDLRYYPAEPILYSLGSYLIPQKTPFASCSVASHEKPGDFVLGEVPEVGGDQLDCYKGKVILIINEFTQSQPEFTAMALRVAPHVKVVGSHSTGADGDMVEIQLPGGITTYMSGIGIYYPDGTQTQRIGIAPDIYVRPTREGIKEGRDELLEKAIEVIEEAKF